MTNGEPGKYGHCILSHAQLSSLTAKPETHLLGVAGPGVQTGLVGKHLRGHQERLGAAWKSPEGRLLEETGLVCCLSDFQALHNPKCTLLQYTPEVTLRLTSLDPLTSCTVPHMSLAHQACRIKRV